jgi:hypothetical protein
LGKAGYIALNVIALSLLTLLFKLDFLKIQWVGAVVIGIFFACAAYIVIVKRKAVCEIDSSPVENQLDFKKIDSIH